MCPGDRAEVVQTLLRSIEEMAAWAPLLIPAGYSENQTDIWENLGAKASERR